MGYTKLSEKLFLNSSTLTAYSQAIAMDGANACYIDATIFSLTGTGGPNVAVTIELSNDLENWASGGTGSGIASGNAVGYFSGSYTAVSSAYIRVKYVLTGTTPTAVVSAGINTALL